MVMLELKPERLDAGEFNDQSDFDFGPRFPRRLFGRALLAGRKRADRR